VKILHISDTHVGHKDDFNKKNFVSIVKKTYNNKFDFMIHTGDLTQSGKKNEYLKAKKLISKIKIPFIVIPGNHDARSGGLYLFKKYIGPSNGVVEIGKAVVVYVNSAVADSNDGRVGMVKFNMMKKALDKYSHKLIKIIVIHHHILPIPRAGRERNILSNAGDIFDLIKRADVDIVLLGHRHYPNVYGAGSTVFVNAGTISSKKTRYGDVNSYNIINITKNTKKITTVRVDGSKETKVYSMKKKRIYSNFGKRECRLIHISNTFISNSKSFLKDHFFNAFNTIYKSDPDLIIHCGGIVKEGIPQDYTIAAKYFNKKRKIPVLFTPAGRDINYLGYKFFKDIFGSFDQSFSKNDMLFQGISSAQYDSPAGIIGETEREAFLKKLTNAKEKFKTVFLHHNLVPLPHIREKGLLEDSGDLLKDLVNANIDLVLTGTSSFPYATKIENTIIVNANSLSSIYQRSFFGNSFNIIDIYENVIAVFEINSLWGKRRLIGMWKRR